MTTDKHDTHILLLEQALSFLNFRIKKDGHDNLVVCACCNIEKVLAYLRSLEEVER